MLWVLIRIASTYVLWRNKQNYSLIITKCPPYLFHCSGLNFTQDVFDARNSEQGLGSVFVSSRRRARFLVCVFFFLHF